MAPLIIHKNPRMAVAQHKIEQGTTQADPLNPESITTANVLRGPSDIIIFPPCSSPSVYLRLIDCLNWFKPFASVSWVCGNIPNLAQTPLYFTLHQPCAE